MSTGPTGPKPIRLAIAGVGNCASSLVQGIEYYRDADPTETVPGLMHVTLGGYHVRDVEVVAAFDVDATKVGLDVGKAVFAGPNNTVRFASVGELGVTVQRGPTLDGLGRYYRETIEESPAEPVDVAEVLAATGAQVLVSYLPVGSEAAQKHYAQACLDTGVAFVNAIPVFIASDPEWAQRFTDAGVPIVGDDIKSQVGSTIVHRLLARLFEERGLVLDHTYQLNVGGNMDFKNMLERERLMSKKISKTQAVTSQITQGIDADDVHIGPSDHVPWLEDRKWAYVRLEGRNFGDVPLNLELKLEVWDSPNSAGVIIDAIRCARLALDRGIGGPLVAPVRLLHEVAAGAVRRHRRPPHAGGVHRRRRSVDHSRRRSVVHSRRRSVVHSRRRSVVHSRRRSVVHRRRRSVGDTCGVTAAVTWNRDLRAEETAGPSDVVLYGPEVPSEADLRLLGTLADKRVLELGCGTGLSSVALAKQGARTIALDFSAEQLAAVRRRADREGVRVETHEGDLAELAFVRADSVDLVFSAYALQLVDDVNRVFRQVHRVLKQGCPLVFSVPHPAFAMIEANEVADPDQPLGVRRSYFDRSRIDLGSDRPPFFGHHHTIGDLFTGLNRNNFRVDTVLEPETRPDAIVPRNGAMRPPGCPRTLIMRARKEGVVRLTGAGRRRGGRRRGAGGGRRPRLPKGTIGAPGVEPEAARRDGTRPAVESPPPS